MMQMPGEMVTVVGARGESGNPWDVELRASEGVNGDAAWSWAFKTVSWGKSPYFMV